ncbi:MAG: hypothetical protein KKG33_07540 [candidate division Zixibacteria bacterium]|nr:hypothetical protein [candidate division Zixibacteria bacterium]MBU1471176.1 hypothetical protein [candidate division Zixibacteria bacterium]MBU2625398.1 hypothetical protein [candidate division Zixibacteria bacterium]
MRLTAGTFFGQAIDYNHRSIAMYSEYSDHGVYLEYTRSTCEICLYVIYNQQTIYDTCKEVPESEWNGTDLQWHELSITLIGDHLETARDEKVDFIFDDDRLKGFPHEGYIHLSVAGAEVCFDNVAMTSLVSYVCGDADGQQTVDIDDVVYLIEYIFSGGSAPDPVEAADADCSGGIDIDDVVYIIAYIFSGGSPPCEGCK